MSNAEVGVSSQERHSTMLLGVHNASSVTSKELKDALEKGDAVTQATALENMIRLHLNGEPQNHMIMTVIKYVTPVEDHLVKKLVLYFWEVVDKVDKDGNLLSIMILICSFLRADLQHPNVYIRGITLRFLCKIDHRDILEPLIGPVLQNLTNSDAYVRRHAVMAVKVIYERFPELIPDAAEQVDAFIQHESDVSARRNAFDMLAANAPDRAARYLNDNRESIINFGSVFLLSVVEFCRKSIEVNPYDRARYVPLLFAVIQSKSPAVQYQCACTLLSLSSSPTAILQAAQTFIDILKSHSDNNVRLIVVEQLNAMRKTHLHVLQDSLLDVLSTLSITGNEIREQIVSLSMELVNEKNMDAFVGAMKRELLRAQSDDVESSASYKAVLIKAISTAVTRRPESAVSVLPLLLDYLCGDDSTSVEVMLLVKEILRVNPSLRKDTLEKVNATLPLMSSSAAISMALWLLGSYTEETEVILSTVQSLKEAMLPTPLTAPAVDTGDEKDNAPRTKVVTTVQEDGTYVTTYVTDTNVSASGESTVGLRAQIVRGKYVVATSLGTALTKLIIRLFAADGVEAAVRNEAQCAASDMLGDILRYATAAGATYPIDDDGQEHLRLSLSMLKAPSSSFLVDLVGDQQWCSSPALEAGGPTGAASKTAVRQIVPVDTPIVFSQIVGGKDASMDMGATSAAGGTSDVLDKAGEYMRQIERVVALSGFMDPVYCEASVTVNEFDVSVDWLLVNCTSDPLKNLTLELATLGGMRLVERPQSYTIEPKGCIQVRSTLKVGAGGGRRQFTATYSTTPPRCP
ncbi:coatomer beta subunit [Angomonas deanei]|nr:coatomer beta subunit [Angomonas deanei]|eukprot:EPY31278.1 coatomer beta subunit [Angomonas deanei]